MRKPQKYLRITNDISLKIIGMLSQYACEQLNHIIDFLFNVAIHIIPKKKLSGKSPTRKISSGIPKMINQEFQQFIKMVRENNLNMLHINENVSSTSRF